MHAQPSRSHGWARARRTCRKRAHTVVESSARARACAGVTSRTSAPRRCNVGQPPTTSVLLRRCRTPRIRRRQCRGVEECEPAKDRSGSPQPARAVAGRSGPEASAHLRATDGWAAQAVCSKAVGGPRPCAMRHACQRQPNQGLAETAEGLSRRASAGAPAAGARRQPCSSEAKCTTQTTHAPATTQQDTCVMANDAGYLPQCRAWEGADVRRFLRSVVAAPAMERSPPAQWSVACHPAVPVVRMYKKACRLVVDPRSEHSVDCGLLSARRFRIRRLPSTTIAK